MARRAEVERSQFLAFTLAGTQYAIPILKVREILQCDGITPVPGVPPSIRGVINLRGSVLPVVDLAVKFGRGETAMGRFTCILVVEAAAGDERMVIGVMADSVSEVIELRADEVLAPPAFGTEIRVEYLVGMAEAGSRFALLLDLDRVLAAGELDLVAVPDAEAAPADSGAPPPPEAAAAEVREA